MQANLTIERYETINIDNTFSLAVSDYQIAAGSCYGDIKIFDIAGKFIKTLKGHQGCINCLQFFNKKLIVSVAEDKTIKIWRKFKSSCSLSGHTDEVKSVDAPRKNKFVISGAKDAIKIWSFSNKKYLRNFIGHENTVLSVKISTNCNIVASGSFDRTVRIWNIITGIFKTCVGHTEYVHSVEIVEDTIISGSFDRTIKIWNI
jgi:WD40 repeat protein